MSKPSINFLRSEDSSYTRKIDLNRELIRHPVSTFFFRAGQNLHGNFGINKGDVLIVDRSWNLSKSAKVIFSQEDGLYFGHMYKDNGKMYIKRGEKVYMVNEDIQIWGAVTYVIHRV